MISIWNNETEQGMNRTINLAYLILALAAILSSSAEAGAQKFSVAEFRVLQNDVSAFVTPVKDLNDEDCALIKVPASADFVFTSPLGIVKRVDNVGEIWLYVPRGSKKITIKHPEWGVIRDYAFPMKIDSHMTYELRIDEPLQQMAQKEVTTVRDTVVFTRVDTLVVAPEVRRVPFSVGIMPTVGYGGNSKTVMGGLLLTAMKRNGAFLHLSTDFGSAGKTIGECDKNGAIGGNTPYYSGDKRHGCLIINAGAAHRLSGKVAIFEGLGYGSNTTSWQLAESEGGGLVKNSFYSKKGVSFEVGAVVTVKRISVSASVISIAGKQWFGSLGIGVNISK